MLIFSTVIVRKFSGLLLLVLGVAAATTSVSAQDASLSLDLNDDAVRLTYQQRIPERQMGFGGSLMNHQDRGLVLSGDFHITGNAATQARPINAGLGVRGVYADVEDGFAPNDVAFIGGIPSKDGYALAVGGFFRGQVPNYDRIGFGGHAYFAPDVLSFGDMDEFIDASLYARYSVLRNGDVYVGARTLRGEFSQFGDVSFDTGLHVGFTLKF